MCNSMYVLAIVLYESVLHMNRFLPTKHVSKIIIIIVYIHTSTYVWITYTEWFLPQHMYNLLTVR